MLINVIETRYFQYENVIETRYFQYDLYLLTYYELYSKDCDSSNETFILFHLSSDYCGRKI